MSDSKLVPTLIPFPAFQHATLKLWGREWNKLYKLGLCTSVCKYIDQSIEEVVWQSPGGAASKLAFIELSLSKVHVCMR